jgi:DUF1680 family protein
MSSKKSRRSFIASAAATAAVSMVATPRVSGSGTLLASLRAGDNPGGSITKPNPDWKDEGVLALGRSPYAKLQSVPVHAVTIGQGFWSKRRTTNVQASIPSMRQELVDHGRMDNFLRLKGRSNAPQRGPMYSDSDIYKWTEAVGFALQSENNQDLRRATDAMIKDVIAVQEPSGYLNTYYVGDRASERMLQHTQEVGHELYNIGHLLQGAIAYYRATGDPTLLDAGIRFVDNFLIPNYGPAANQKPIVAGHPEIEMSLIELYRTTGNKRYLDLAGYILHGDERLTIKRSSIVYMYCGIPFTSRTKLEGHAVRAMYACCGATDYYLETGDQSYWKTLSALWEDLSRHQMYVTGGVGARSEGEAFGDAYELPNATAYGESCAAIGNMMWNWRMLAASGEARFTDVIERALYNGINSGMSLDGKLYCYRNPLAFDPATGDKIRNPWYDTTCCPPNIERTFASLPGYFYSTSKDGVYVHLYDNSEVNWHLASGTAFKLKQKTNYPWDGRVSLTVDPARPEEFTLYARIPGWSKSNTVKVNGEEVAGVTPGEYLALRRRWSSGDSVDLTFDMKPQMLNANPAVADDTGRIALQRGPIVYCMEHVDQNPDHRDTQRAGGLSRYAVKLTGDTASHYAAELLDGVMLLQHPGTIASPVANPALYESAGSGSGDVTPTTLKSIPYYAWANREPSAMQVWIPYTRT